MIKLVHHEMVINSKFLEVPRLIVIVYVTKISGLDSVAEKSILPI